MVSSFRVSRARRNRRDRNQPYRADERADPAWFGPQPCCPPTDGPPDPPQQRVGPGDLRRPDPQAEKDDLRAGGGRAASKMIPTMITTSPPTATPARQICPLPGRARNHDRTPFTHRLSRCHCRRSRLPVPAWGQRMLGRLVAAGPVGGHEETVCAHARSGDRCASAFRRQRPRRLIR